MKAYDTYKPHAWKTLLGTVVETEFMAKGERFFLVTWIDLTPGWELQTGRRCWQEQRGWAGPWLP